LWWLGTGWSGCRDAAPTWQRDPLLQLGPGVPLGGCEEARPGVFERRFSRGTASLDCNLQQLGGFAAILDSVHGFEKNALSSVFL
jgi:hypothetical protein